MRHASHGAAARRCTGVVELSKEKDFQEEATALLRGYRQLPLFTQLSVIKAHAHKTPRHLLKQTSSVRPAKARIDSCETYGIIDSLLRLRFSKTQSLVHPMLSMGHPHVHTCSSKSDFKKKRRGRSSNVYVWMLSITSQVRPA